MELLESRIVCWKIKGEEAQEKWAQENRATRGPCPLGSRLSILEPPATGYYVRNVLLRFEAPYLLSYICNQPIQSSHKLLFPELARG